MTTMSTVVTPPQTAEQVLFAGRTHIKVLFRPAMAQLALSTIQVATWLFWPEIGDAETNRWASLVVHGTLMALMAWYAIIPVLRWRASVFEVTSRRLRMRWGVLYKHSREIHLDRITQIEVERGILDRLVRCGSIIAYDATKADAIRFHDVPQFQQVRDVIDEARHALHAPPPNL